MRPPLLPESVAQAGHPARYAALMLETEALLYLERWGEAAAAVGEVIDSDRYGLVEVSRPTTTKKSTARRPTPRAKRSSISNTIGTTATTSWRCIFAVEPGARRRKRRHLHRLRREEQLRQNWDKADLRYQHNLWIQTGNSTLQFADENGHDLPEIPRLPRSTTGAANGFPVHRYADALLYAAEAICRHDGKPDETAMEALNQVHRRAYGLKPHPSAGGSDFRLTDYDTQDKFMKLLLQERGYETAFRRKTLLRPETLWQTGRIRRQGAYRGESEVGPAAYWWPVPADEFNYNTSLDPTKDQNPGY